MTIRAMIDVGPRALLVEVADAGAALSLAAAARAAGVDAEEVIPAAATVLFDGVDPGRLRSTLSSIDTTTVTDPGQLVVIPVTYSGADLDDVAERWGCSREAVVRRHTSLEFRVAFCGFSPGFAYLDGLPAEWALPRLPSPRPRVPAGSVALADAWCAVYPQAAPGGWQLLGQTPRPLWDPDAEQPALLAPGARVRFEST